MMTDEQIIALPIPEPEIPAGLFRCEHWEHKTYYTRSAGHATGFRCVECYRVLVAILPDMERLDS